MTITELHTAFRLELDKTGSLDYPDYLPEEIDYWLNSAIRKLVKTRYSGMNIKGESFEQTRKRKDDLRTLVYETSIAAIPVTGDIYKPNTYLAVLPESYWFAGGQEATIVVNSVSKRVGVVEITSDQYDSYISNPHSEHVLHYNTAKPLVLFRQGTVELITDGNYSVSFYHIRYLIKPQSVSFTTYMTTNLPEHTHDEIVKLAVSMALENIEQPRYQTISNELRTIE